MIKAIGSTAGNYGNGGYRNDGYYGSYGYGNYGGYRNGNYEQQELNSGYQQGSWNTGLPMMDAATRATVRSARAITSGLRSRAFREGFIRGYDAGYRQTARNRSYRRSTTAAAIWVKSLASIEVVGNLQICGHQLNRNAAARVAAFVCCVYNSSPFVMYALRHESHSGCTGWCTGSAHARGASRS